MMQIYQNYMNKITMHSSFQWNQFMVRPLCHHNPSGKKARCINGNQTPIHENEIQFAFTMMPFNLAIDNALSTLAKVKI